MSATVTAELKPKLARKSRWSAEQLKELQDALAKQSEVKSQNDLSKIAGVNPGVLSFVKNSQWEQVSDAMVAKLRAFFSLDEWQLRQSQNLKLIEELCHDARNNKRFLATCGFTGAGKTVSLKMFCRKNSECHYVLATAVMTRKGFVEAIMRAMAIKEDGNLEQKIGYIVNKLRSSLDALLVVDDAGKLSDPCLQLLQIIYDETENNAGIVIGGVDLLKKRIDKNAAKDKMGFRELKRRIAYWQPLVRPERGFIQTVCADFGITDTKAVRYIISSVQDFGTLRNLITNAVKARDLNENEVTVELLLDLHLGDEHYKAG
jgi:AAA domain